jgi:hypothetical protein
VISPGHDGGVGVRQGLGEMGYQVVGERQAVAAGDQVNRLMNLVGQSVVELPPSDGWYFTGEEVAAIGSGPGEAL